MRLKVDPALLWENNKEALPEPLMPPRKKRLKEKMMV